MLNRKFIISSLAFILIVFSACKKAVDNAKQDLLVSLITDNNWIVVGYLDGPTDITADYANYEFDFNKDGTVNANKNGVTEATGTWVGSEVTQSITSNFPGAYAPINKLTGIWEVTNTKSKPWRVFSHRFEGGKEVILDLQEK